jgi:cell division protein FtsQ
MTINWKKTAVVLLDIVIAAYLVLAISVFNEPEEKATVCTAVNIDIAEQQDYGFLTPAEVKRLLEKSQQYPLAQPMQFVSTRNMEEVLLRSPFVDKVECYKTQNGHVNIRLTQRQPVLHIMTNRGEQYYVDAHGDILPHTRLAGNLLIATGAISHEYASKRLAPIASQILADRFWQEQTEQLNILPDGTLELVPRVGDHVVYLGAPRDIPRKLERLRKFYKFGLSHAGWDRYERINMEFDNQIICKKRS